MTATEFFRDRAASPAVALPDAQTVLSVRHWDDRLFSFRLTRSGSFRFRSGEFVMIGLPGDNGKPILRAYSIASPFWDEELEFYSIKVPGGPLTSRLQKSARAIRSSSRPSQPALWCLMPCCPASGCGCCRLEPVWPPLPA